jgi:hypothetical protein
MMISEPSRSFVWPARIIWDEENELAAQAQALQGEGGVGADPTASSDDGDFHKYS